MSVKGRVLFLSILSSLMRIIISAVIVGMGSRILWKVSFRFRPSIEADLLTVGKKVIDSISYPINCN